MIQSVPRTDRAPAVWSSPSRSLDRLAQAARGVLRWGLSLTGFGNDQPESWMSREWLDEYERQSRERNVGV